MKISLPCLLLPFLLFFSCSRDNTVQYETNPSVETVVNASVPFSSFAAELPVLALPFKATCSFDYLLGSRLDTTVASAYLKPHELPYRRFSVSKEVTALLLLFPTDETLPRIRTYRQDGTQLDEQDLKFNPCGEEPGFLHSEQYTIQKDFTIVHIDSTTRWQFDAAYQEIPNTRKLTVTKKRFRILPNGDINEIK
ncbi:hypothetical protein ACD591_05815 [Rufibacter glacialis]|uniref:Lipoprotein n=1 Tax=Rufibacter glacialis TaxID=1259555 RepID=A0A5M8QB08_9BACT|nr:hypothetical protein [Rufibacter glacialis]KAA6433177.1 hypothetical protein FOE74_11865 [Rufibacter glacialis]GGK76724.1 hypothetical protein GCM10011405_25670 [Rufibacter glacialis]